jgi:hypothetical protein
MGAFYKPSFVKTQAGTSAANLTQQVLPVKQSKKKYQKK